ncbi:sigma-70 family RNA polymerase sigma factor [Streptomyces sp. NPDC002692]
MSVDGRDESLGDGGAEAGGLPSQQVPSQGGPPGDDLGPSAPPRPAGVPNPSGAPHLPGPSGGGQGPTGDPSVPAQRDRFDPRDVSSVLPPPPELPPSDADLIGRMRSGDDTAYEALYRRHADAVRRYARTCCRDAHTADDLTAEVFARMLQAVRGGHGPEHAVRAYLLTTVRRVAAHWTKTAKREQLVDDFAVFAAQAARGTEGPDDDTLGLGADARALREADRSMAMQAFRSLPERWQAVLWHTEVEDESPSEVATLFGLDANGTRVLASRAREGLKQAYLQAHVSATLTGDEECARYADRLGAYARGGLRTRAERGLRKHLEECAKCRLAAGQIKEVASGIPAVVPVAVIGWFGAAGYAKAVALIAGGAGAGAAGAAAAAGGSGAAGAAGGSGAAAAAGGSGAAGGGAAASEGLGAPVKAGIAAGVVAVAAAAVALALVGNETAARKPEARPAASPAVEAPPRTPALPPSRRPAPQQPVAATVPARTPAPAPAPKSPPKPAPTPSQAPTKAAADPTPDPTPPPSAPLPPDPAPTPTPAPEPVVYRWNQLRYDLTGDHTRPEMRLGASSWVWQRWGMSIADQRYAYGVTVHGTSSVTVDLNRSCSAYEARVGVDDLTMGLGRVSFSVYADGARLWRSPLVAGGDRAIPVRVDLTGRRTVRLVVEPRTPFDSVTLADWAESKFECR